MNINSIYESEYAELRAALRDLENFYAGILRELENICLPQEQCGYILARTA